ncbi:MAG: glutaredoxin 3 [Gammaproteobacteria bacterium TMED78]|nr:MAG: glutaredoxin 3 [Gammaproteobacteria bacterium TMED78]|tara:strand:+ start:456 stop:710 length:255 start_codon:yes stop_codon:yes gene_type:complete
MIEIYTTDICGYCEAAKKLLQNKSLKYKEINMTNDKSLQLEIINKTGLKTVPQIFIDGKHIGGFNELRNLSITGKLDLLIDKVS